jgi:ABC-2 type transport system ATP-binding protein
MALTVDSISKRFGSVQAVDHVSFQVEAGRVCGLLGSNGAGKTTSMRMIMRIFLPDEGTIFWNGAPITDNTRKAFGYLPEERGLYPKFEVREQLIYFAQLKGLSRLDAEKRVDRWIDQLELGEYRGRKLEQLSKGNQQKVQFAAAVAAGPALCILDEPFTGLDPVNTLVMEEAFRTVAREGTTLLFSAHNLDQVESLCEDVVLLHRSHVVLQGALREIKKSFRRKTIKLTMESGDYRFLAGVSGAAVREGKAGAREISLPGDMAPNDLLKLAAANGTVTEYSLGDPSLREIYLEKVGGTDE